MEILECLPFFYSFTGCDTVSAFADARKQHGKFGTFFPTVSTAFEHLAAGPSEIDKADFETLEHFVVLLYDKSCSSTSVKQERSCLPKDALLSGYLQLQQLWCSTRSEQYFKVDIAGQNTSYCSGPCQSFTVGLEVESRWTVDSILVRLARSGRYLHRTDQLWLQEDLSTPLQVLPCWPSLNRAVCVRWLLSQRRRLITMYGWLHRLRRGHTSGRILFVLFLRLSLYRAH
ncbi:hypothetical protein ACOMHN_016999 [Nucella lapillus]